MKLHVLVVDDDEGLLADLRETWRGHEGVELHLAASESEGLKALDTHLFVLVLVDLQLDEDNADTLEGAAVLERAAARQPIAHLYAMTAYPNIVPTARTVVRQLLDPNEPVAYRLRGLIDKTEQDPVAAVGRTIESRLEALGQNPITVSDESISMVVSHLTELESVSNWESVVPEARFAEVDFVIGLLFGQGSAYGDGLNRPVRSVEIHPFEDLAKNAVTHTGNSGAAVYLARTQMASGVYGDWVVVKFGNRSDIDSEIGRYELFVRFDGAAKHRVELLGSAGGNHLAALSYSLAAARPEDVTTLKTPLQEQRPDAIEAISTLFSPAWRHWHVTPVPPLNPLIHLQQDFAFEFNIEVASLATELGAAVRWRNEQNHSGGVLWHISDADVKAGDLLNVKLPDERLVGRLSRRVNGCICHGDTHAANVMFNDPSDVRLIDYANTGPGPRALDFATIEASQRVIHSESCSIDEALNTVIIENRVWRAVWAIEDPVGANVADIVSFDSPFWAKFSANVLLLMRQTFPEMAASEYAQVAVLHGVRLTPAWWITGAASRPEVLRHIARVRLVAWMSRMVEELR